MMAFSFCIIVVLLCAGILDAANVLSSPCPLRRIVKVEAGESTCDLRCMPHSSCAVFSHLWLHVDPTEAVNSLEVCDKAKPRVLSVLLRTALANHLVFH